MTSIFLLAYLCFLNLYCLLAKSLHAKHKFAVIFVINILHIVFKTVVERDYFNSKYHIVSYSLKAAICC